MFHVASSLYKSGNLERIRTSIPKFRIGEQVIPSNLINADSRYHLALTTLVRAGLGSPDFHMNLALKNIHYLDRKTSHQIGNSNLIAMSSLGLLTARTVKRRGNIFIVNRSSHHILAQKVILEELATNWAWDELIPSQESIERELEEYELADKIIVPSKASYDSFSAQNVNMDKVVINPFPLTKNTEPNSASMRRDILFVGSVTLRKGFHTLVKAFNSLNMPGVKLHVVGIYSKEFLIFLRKNGLDLVNVVFYGPLNSTTLIRFYRTIDVLVLPSIEDGWGMVVNEAMVQGCIPIVSTGAGSSDQIENGKNGYVFEAGNIDELKNCIQQALGNEQLRLTLFNSIETSTYFQRNWDDFSRIYLDAI